MLVMSSRSIAWTGNEAGVVGVASRARRLTDGDEIVVVVVVVVSGDISSGSRSRYEEEVKEEGEVEHVAAAGDSEPAGVNCGMLKRAGREAELKAAKDAGGVGSSHSLSLPVAVAVVAAVALIIATM